MVTAVDGVSFQLPRGRTLGLVGESGCGKSSLARALVGLLEVSGGRIMLDETDCTSSRARNSRDYRRRVQMIFQDPFSSLNPRMTAGRAVEEALGLSNGTSKQARRARTAEMFELVGLGRAAMPKYPHQFSGGQRQRIAIARALAVGPDILITDEITSSLDVSTQATILNLLASLQAETGIALLFISHDLSVVQHASDAVAVMYLGQIVEMASTTDLFEVPQHPYSNALIESVPQVGQRRKGAPLHGDLPDPRKPPRGCRFHTRCPIGPMHNPDRMICIDSDPQRIARGRLQQAACHFADV